MDRSLVAARPPVPPTAGRDILEFPVVYQKALLRGSAVPGRPSGAFLVNSTELTNSSMAPFWDLSANPKRDVKCSAEHFTRKFRHSAGLVHSLPEGREPGNSRAATRELEPRERRTLKTDIKGGH